jgi:hypothetical protein
MHEPVSPTKMSATTEQTGKGESRRDAVHAGRDIIRRQAQIAEKVTVGLNSIPDRPEVAENMVLAQTGLHVKNNTFPVTTTGQKPKRSNAEFLEPCSELIHTIYVSCPSLTNALLTH